MLGGEAFFAFQSTQHVVHRALKVADPLPTNSTRVSHKALQLHLPQPLRLRRPPAVAEGEAVAQAMALHLLQNQL
jgi:hypothetical protein